MASERSPKKRKASKTKSKPKPRPKSLSNRSAAKRKKVRKKPPPLYNPKERAAMFVYYCETRNLAGTARHFGCSKTTIHKIKVEDKWDDRFREVLDDVQGKSNRAAAKGIISNVETAKKLLDKITQKIDVDGVEADTDKWTRLARYIDEMEGGMPVTRRSELIVRVIDEINGASREDRLRLVQNALAGVGIVDPELVQRASEIWFSGLYSSDGN